MQQRQTGTVKWFNRKKRFGFIILADGRELFVHYRAIRGGRPYYLREGQEVEFSIGESQKGPEARDVTIVKPGQQQPGPRQKPGFTGFLRTLFSGKSRSRQQNQHQTDKHDIE